MQTATTPRRSPCLGSLSLVLLLGLVGCNKEEAKDTAAAATSASAPSASGGNAVVAPSMSAVAAPPSATASAAPVPPPKCPAGLTGNAVPPFCIKLPASYTVKDARTSPTRGSIAYDTGNATDNLMVSYDDRPISEQAKDVESEMKFGGDKLEKKGDLPGGNKWYQGSHQDFERVVTLIKGPAPLTLKCSFAYKPKNAPPKEALDACKSIVPPAP
jgi:hypothetical protein